MPVEIAHAFGQYFESQKRTTTPSTSEGPKIEQKKSGKDTRAKEVQRTLEMKLVLAQNPSQIVSVFGSCVAVCKQSEVEWSGSQLSAGV